jgi:glutathione synthase/RimK-type ligase-like ATP-grasp enzyme
MILCLSHSGDFYNIDIVQKRIKELGYPSLRINTNLIPGSIRVEYRISGNGEPSLRLRGEGFEIDSSEVQAVWYRKIWPISIAPDIPAEYRSGVLGESNAIRNIFFESLQHVPWINPMHTDEMIGNNKFIQLTEARKCGITIPQTLISNNKEEVILFYEQCKGKMITKMHQPLSISMTGGGMSFPTTRIYKKDLKDLDTLHLCPMIFQELILKDVELRIAYIDGDFFTGAVNTQASVKGKTDWRYASDVPFKWEHYELPAEIKDKLHRMMQNLGLPFGAIDMMVTPEGRHIFLEVNPQGEWGMIQRDLQLPIAETIAEKLIKRIKQ